MARISGFYNHFFCNQTTHICPEREFKRFFVQHGVPQSSDVIFHEMQSYYTYNSGYYPTPADVASYPTMSDIKMERSVEKKSCKQPISSMMENDLQMGQNMGIKLERGSSPGADSGHSDNGQSYELSSNEDHLEHKSRGPATPDSGHNSSHECQNSSHLAGNVKLG